MSIPRTAKTVVSRLVAELKADRVRKGISMNRLAELTRLSLTTISYVEREMRNPTFETILRIGLALDVDILELLRRALSGPTGEPTRPSR